LKALVRAAPERTIVKEGLMTRIVSPQEFNAAFLAVAKRRRAEVRDVWNNRPAYTDFCLGDANGLLTSVSKRLRLQYCCQYFGIDAVMCEKVDAINFSPDYWWAAEQLTVAIEHENVIAGAHQEMNKLSIFNSPLKVLITYPWVSTKNDYLATYADIARRADIFNDFTTRRRHLVIFGFGPEDDVTWESYVYRLGEFVPLEATS
jgi:hypothetical protein